VHVALHPRDDGGLALRVVVSGPLDQDAPSLSLPEVDGIRWDVPNSRDERTTTQRVTTYEIPFSAKPRAYTLQAVCAAASDERTCAEPLYVDIGAPPDRSGMADIFDPPEVREIPWLTLGAGTISLSLLGIGLYMLRRAREEEASPEPVVLREAPDRVALRAWDAVRGDPTLSAEDKAQALSEIFRAYVEEVLDVPARAWTSRQTLDHLSALNHLPDGNVERASRLLRATDRVKYAAATPGPAFFETLGDDLRAFIQDTRPRSWGET
jgi:hypothetical protein